MAEADGLTLLLAVTGGGGVYYSNGSWETLGLGSLSRLVRALEGNINQKNARANERGRLC